MRRGDGAVRPGTMGRFTDQSGSRASCSASRSTSPPGSPRSSRSPACSIDPQHLG